MELARFNMVEQQIRPWDVLDVNVLDLIKKVKREHFVPVDKQSLAFMDVEIPLGHDVKMWSPKLEARALQALKLKHSDLVLEVGTGSGYLDCPAVAHGETRDQYRTGAGAERSCGTQSGSASLR